MKMSLNPKDYSLEEIQKALVAACGFIAFAILFLLKKDFDPNLVELLQTLVPTGFAVYAVFATAKSSPADINKALVGFISAGVGVWQYFGTVNESTVETLVILAGYAATFYGVFKIGNKPPIDDQRNRPQPAVTSP